MKRLRLIWFAAGAATSAVCTIVATFLLQSQVTLDGRIIPTLVLEEPLNVQALVEGGTPPDEDMIANQTSQFLRDCGAKAFEATALRGDVLPTADYPLVPENYGSIECVLKGLGEAELEFSVDMRWDSKVVREVRERQ